MCPTQVLLEWSDRNLIWTSLNRNVTERKRWVTKLRDSDGLRTLSLSCLWAHILTTSSPKRRGFSPVNFSVKKSQGRLDWSGLDHMSKTRTDHYDQIQLSSKDQPAMWQTPTLRSTAMMKGVIWTPSERSRVDGLVRAKWGTGTVGRHSNLSHITSVDNIICQVNELLCLSLFHKKRVLCDSGGGGSTLE